MLNMETLDRVSSALESALAGDDLTEFYDVLRASELPFVAVGHNGDACGLARACRDIVHRLGGLSPAVALAFENHLFVTAVLATLPLENDGLNVSAARAVLEKVGRERLFVANTSSRVLTNKLSTIGAVARREGDGFRIKGSAAYTSLATQSDLLLFTTLLEEGGWALFVAPLRDQTGIEIGPFLFPRAMIASDTRRIEFRDLYLPAESLLQGGRSGEMAKLNQFWLSWHVTMVSALYLGAAARAIEEVRRFLRSASLEGKLLAELDGMVVDAGRLALRYRAARAVVDRAVEALGRLAQDAFDSQRITKTFELATAAKYVGTNYAEEIITKARKIIGTRSFTGGHPLERLSMESPFGPLGPEPDAFIERLHGRAVLGEQPFTVTMDDAAALGTARTADTAELDARRVPVRRASRRKRTA
jgi:alkylation response protein AidB-like acyl-CoA dehydrogenase